MRFDRLACTVLAAMALGGCASYVTTDVTAFQDGVGSANANRTYTFTRSGAQANSIEERTYERLVSQELSVHGFRKTAPADAHFGVSLHYSLENRTVVVPQPMYYDPWPAPYPYAWGPWWGAPMPMPPAYVAQPYPLYVAMLRIQFVDRATGRQVYDVTARHVGPTPSLAPLIPYLARSALADFPLPNGTVRQVRVRVGPAPGGPNEVAAAPDNVPPPPAPEAGVSPAK